MSLPYRSTVIQASADQVWEAVRRFNGIADWHPVIDSSSLDSGQEGQVGAVRRLVLGDGGVVVERLLALDDEARRLTYVILESPFAVRRYVSTIRVAPVTDSDAAFVEWFAEFDSEAGDEAEMMTLFGDGVFGAGLDALRGHVGS